MTARWGARHRAAMRHGARLQWRRVRRRLVWVAIGLLIVGIPLALFALVGLPHLYRAPRIQRVVTRGGEGPPAVVASAQFALAAEPTLGTSLTPGNVVEALTNGDGTFPRLWQDLRAARRSITVQMYYAGPGAVADSVTRILATRARAGVEVYVLLDAFGTQNLPPRYLAAMRTAGVRVARFRPLRWYSLDRGSHRLHVRGIIIDGAVGYTGGFGFDDKWLGRGRRPREWRETNVRFAGPAVGQLQAAFIAEWTEATGDLLTGASFLPLEGTAAAPAGTADAAVVYSPPSTGGTAAERLYALSIASARERLYVSNAYFIPDAAFVRLLVEAARRGVDVRVLTNGAQTDVQSTRLASRWRYDALLAGGVRIYEYRPTTIHAKTFVVDGTWSAIGTMNFDNRSLAYNNEVALVVRDGPFGASMDSLFLDDLRFADEIRLEAFRQRPRRERLLERAAHVIAGLL